MRGQRYGDPVPSCDRLVVWRSEMTWTSRVDSSLPSSSPTQQGRVLTSIDVVGRCQPPSIRPCWGNEYAANVSPTIPNGSSMGVPKSLELNRLL